MKLFVGNIPYSMSEEELTNLFGEIGALASCKIIMDRETGRSKGFGFVEYQNKDDAQAAIEKLNNTEVQGKALVVNKARPPEKRGSSFGGGAARPPKRRS